MSKKVFICYNADDGINDGAGKGNSLKEAFEDYKEYICDDASPDALTFIEGECIEVEFKIERKPVVTKIAPAKEGSSTSPECDRT